MTTLQTWHLLRGKKLTAGDIHNGKSWEEFDKECHPKWKKKPQQTLSIPGNIKQEGEEGDS